MATPFAGARSNSRAKGEDMYLWRKYASSQWLLSREAVLQERTNFGLAVIQSLNRKRLRLEVASSSRRVVESLGAQFGGEIERLPRNWRRQFAEAQVKPVQIGTRLTIRSTRKNDGEKAHGGRQLIIPAAGAFGTGEHATTAMCLRLLERVSRPWSDGWSMLDAGTGSGIFALAARCLGARDVMAIDTDPGAIAIAQSNARLNRISGIQFRIADVKHGSRRKFDVIVANLFSELLIAMIPAWTPRLKGPRLLILSGVLRRQEGEVFRSLRNSNLTVQEIRRRGKWIALCARVARASGLRMI